MQIYITEKVGVFANASCNSSLVSGGSEARWRFQELQNKHESVRVGFPHNAIHKVFRDKHGNTAPQGNGENKAGAAYLS